MAQVQKEHVRAAIEGAALALVAARGYDATTIAAVAARAGTSVGNVYKYFPDKEALFAAALPAAFARDLEERTRARVEALGAARDVGDLPGGARYHALSADLVEHAIANRERVAILLVRGASTPYAGFAAGFADALTAWALSYAARAHPSLAPTPRLRHALGHAYRSFLAGLGEALLAFEAPAEIREAVAALTAYHQGGLLHLFTAAEGARS